MKKGIVILIIVGVIVLPFLWSFIAKGFLYFLYGMELAINYLNGHEMFSFYKRSLNTLRSIKSEKHEYASEYRSFVVIFLIILWPISFIIGYIIYGIVLGYSLIFF